MVDFGAGPDSVDSDPCHESGSYENPLADCLFFGLVSSLGLVSLSSLLISSKENNMGKVEGPGHAGDPCGRDA